MMNKFDYEEVVEVIRSFRYSMKDNVYQEMVLKLADKFSMSNPVFPRDWFFKQCGVAPKAQVKKKQSPSYTDV